MTRGSRHGSHNSQSGVAFVELAVTLPFLIMFLFLLLETSRVLNELVWAANTAYQLASVLGTNPRGVGEDLMLARFQQIMDPTVESIRKKEFGMIEYAPERERTGPRQPTSPDFGGQYYDPNPNHRTVGLTLGAEINTLSHIVGSIPFSVTVTSPYLLADEVAAPMPENSSKTFDCCGKLNGPHGPTTVTGRPECFDPNYGNVCDSRGGMCLGEPLC
jgi:hypothetical protein